MLKTIIFTFLIFTSACLFSQETSNQKVLTCLSANDSKEFDRTYSELNQDEQLLVETISSMSEEEKAFALTYLSLNWKEIGIYSLSNHSTLSLPKGYKLLLDRDANKYLDLIGEPKREGVEALVFDESFEHSILFQYSDSGYISLDDWSDLNSEQLLESIIENTKKANKERKLHNSNSLHVIGWIQEPTLDRNTNTVYWAIEAKEENVEDPLVNSVALRLGREGFECIVWVTNKDQYTPFGGILDVMLRAHSFDPDYKYTDYTSGDKLAGYGIAALVAATVGGKIAKIGGFAGFALLFKKFWCFLIAGVAIFFKRIKEFLKNLSN